MRVLVVIHERDMAQLQRLVLQDNRLSADLFAAEDCNFELCTYADGGRQGLFDDAGRSISPEDMSRRCSTIVLVAADHAVNSSHLTKLLRTFLLGKKTPVWSNEALIVLRLANTEHSGLHSLPQERVFYAPPLDAPSPDAPGSPDWIHGVRAELEGLVKTVDENQTINPNVGFGLLLADRDCNFFLMERLREPGKGKLGTIGGNFYRGRDIVAQLDSVLKRRFRAESVPQVDLGPLLACTNMKGPFLHYVDLTFLAIIREGDARDVSDDELRPLGPSALDLLPKRRRGTNKVMFSFSDVAVFFNRKLLFAPVANAFESFCRATFSDQLRHGHRKVLWVPSLVDEGRMLSLELPRGIESVWRTVAALHPWSKTALPFFEGGI